MEAKAKSIIRSEFDHGSSWTRIKADHPKLSRLRFAEVLEALELSSYEEYHAQYEKNHSRARYYARSSSGFRTNREKALDRDGRRCIVCRAQADIVHHIDEFRESQDSDLANLITLCARHHAAAHGRVGPFMLDRSGRRQGKAAAFHQMKDAMSLYARAVNARTGRRLAPRRCMEGSAGREVLRIVEMQDGRSNHRFS